MRRRIFFGMLVGIICSTCFQIHAQQISVFNSKGLPLPGAVISYKGLSCEVNGSLITDRKGISQLPEYPNLPCEGFELTISFIGFKTRVLDISGHQSINITLQEDQVSLNQVVVTGQYTPNPVDEAVQRIEVIDQERIKSLGAVSLRDVLSQELNIRVSQDQVLGSGLSLQGISGQNVKILVNGVPVIGRLNGNVDVSQINLNNVERIELVQGPLSVNYGTDALAGTINIITKSSDSRKVGVSLKSYTESVGQYNLDGLITGKVGSGTLSLSGGRNYFDGWSQEDPFIDINSTLIADSTRSKDWNPKTQYFGRLQYDMETDNFSISPFAEYFNEVISNKGFPRAPQQTTAFDDIYATNRINGGINVSGAVGEQGNFNFIAAYNHFERNRNTYFTDLTTLEQQLTENPSDQDTSVFTLAMTRASYVRTNERQNIQFEIGYDLNYETGRDKRIEGGFRDQGDYALFTSTEWIPTDKLVIRPGVRWSYNTDYEAPIIPSLHVKYDFSSIVVRASYARGFRAPALKELYFDFVDINHNIKGSADLKAEESNNFQLDLTWKEVKTSCSLSGTMGAYYNDIQNLITLVQLNQDAEYGYVNVGEFSTGGLRAGAGLNTERINLDAAGVYSGRRQSLSNENGLDSFTFSPEFQTSFRYRLKKLNSSFNVFYKYTGELPGLRLNLEGQVVESYVQDYHTLDISVTKTFWNELLNLTLGGKNLLDVSDIQTGMVSGGIHSPAGQVPVAWGSSVFIALTLNLQNKK